MAELFKRVEDREGSSFIENTVKLGVNTLTQEKLKFTKVDRGDISDRPYAHLYSSFNLPITPNQINDFTSGRFTNTAVSGINQSEVIVVEIPQNEYGELVDGKTVVLNLPILSGATVENITCYSTFFSNASFTSSNADSLYSDPNTFSNYFGVRQNQEVINQTGVNHTNVAYLYSNEIEPPKSGGQWDNTTFRGGKKFANYLAPADEPIGIVYLDKGFIVLTNQQIVQDFVYSATTSSGFDGIPSGNTYTGGSDFTEVYFDDVNDASLSFNSIKTEFSQSIICIVEQNEFSTSNNPTFRIVNGDDNLENNPVYITEIGLYNEDKELIAIAKPAQPIQKGKEDMFVFNVNLKL